MLLYFKNEWRFLNILSVVILIDSVFQSWLSSIYSFDEDKVFSSNMSTKIRNRRKCWFMQQSFLTWQYKLFNELCINYASPSSRETYNDRQLTTNFELWVEIFCVLTCFHMRIPKPCLSVCPYPEKKNQTGFVNINPTLVVDTSMDRSSRVLQHGTPIFFKAQNWILTYILTCAKELKYFDLCQRAEITLASSISVLH